MEKTNQESCRCDKSSCGCDGAKVERCACGPVCDCDPKCRCEGGCDCARSK